jgi:exodeoxyribonuclease VII large subunit
MPDSASKLLSSLFAPRPIYTVSELTGRVRELIEAEFFDLTVQGEISNYRRHHSGHWYFTLKDRESQLRAVYLRQWNRLLRFTPENGLEVRVRGRLSLYAARGEYELLVETMEPVGVGALQLAFEQQVRRLAAEGLFDAARKRPLPLLPRRIGIVTSPVGSVIQDMLGILARRNPSIHVVIAPARVQGRGAALEIAAAIRLLNDYGARSGSEIDAIIVGRGGGSSEDLWAFNEEEVVRAIHQSRIPVISAVGHETDVTISDFVADLRAPTPSVAAELVAPEAAALNARLSQLTAALERAMQSDLLHRQGALGALLERDGLRDAARLITAISTRRRELEARAGQAVVWHLRESRRRLRDAQSRLAHADLSAPLAFAASRLESLGRRLERAGAWRLAVHRRDLEAVVGLLNALSPLAVLGRGYALVRDAQGRLVTRAGALHQEQEVKLRFSDGEARGRITEIEPLPADKI